MGATLHNISVEGIAPSALSKKKSELHSIIIDYKSGDADGGYRFHGVTIEKMGTPNVVVKTFDSSGNVVAGADVTLNGTSIGVSNDLGYIYHVNSGNLTDTTMVASKTDYTAETAKVSVNEGMSTFQSFYLAPSAGESAVVDKAVFKISAEKFIKRTSTAGVKSFGRTLKSAVSNSGNFSTSNVTALALYNHFVVLTAGSPAADKVILITVDGRYKYIRRYTQGGSKKYQLVSRSALDNVSNFNSSSHTEREIFDFMCEYISGTNPSS